VFRQEHGHNIIAVRHVPDAEYPAVHLGGAGYLPLLSQINVSDDRCKVVRATRLDLDKTDGLSVDRDDIDLASDLNALAVAANRYFEVRDDQPVTGSGEESSGHLLTAFAQRDRWGRFAVFR